MTADLRGSGSPPPQGEQAHTGLDHTDVAILTALDKDGRISINRLAQKVHISRANAYSRFRRLQASGVITGFTVRLDSRALGLGVAAVVALTTSGPLDISEIASLKTMPEVALLVETSGEFDAFMLVRAHEIAGVHDVLHRLRDIRGVTSTRTFFILDETLPYANLLPQA